MSFAAPIWLISLLPWAAVTAYLLLGQRRREQVPFINLWRGPIKGPKSHNALQAPPLWVALMLCAIAVGVLAAARPLFRTSNQTPAIPPDEHPIGIAAMTARGNQLMLRVLNNAASTSGQVALETDRGSTTSNIELPAVGSMRNYFLDMPADATRVSAKLIVDHKTSGNRVALERRQTWPAVQLAGTLPAEVQRIIGIYKHQRPSTDDSFRVVISSDGAAVRDVPGVIVAVGNQSAAGVPQASVHEINANVDWIHPLDDATLAELPADSGWTPIVTLDGRAIIAIREKPSRQVWIGFTSPSFARSPAFVMLWTNVLDWAVRGVSEFQPVPGTAFVALQAESVQNAVQTGFDLTPWVALVAVVLSAVAAAVIRKPFP